MNLKVGEIHRLAVIRDREVILGQVADGISLLVGDIDVNQLQDDGDFVLERLLELYGFPLLWGGRDAARRHLHYEQS
jgi:hypothetical protein